MKLQKGTFYDFITSIFINDRLSVLQPTTTTCTSGRWTATQSSGERCGVSVASSAPNLTTRWVQSWYTVTDDVFQRHILEEDSGNTQGFSRLIQHIDKENHQHFCLTYDYFRFCQSAIILSSFQNSWTHLCGDFNQVENLSKLLNSKIQRCQTSCQNTQVTWDGSPPDFKIQL